MKKLFAKLRGWLSWVPSGRRRFESDSKTRSIIRAFAKYGMLPDYDIKTNTWPFPAQLASPVLASPDSIKKRELFDEQYARALVRTSKQCSHCPDYEAVRELAEQLILACTGRLNPMTCSLLLDQPRPHGPCWILCDEMAKQLHLAITELTDDGDPYPKPEQNEL